MIIHRLHIVYFSDEHSGTAQTVRIAKNKGIEDINIYDKI